MEQHTAKEVFDKWLALAYDKRYVGTADQILQRGITEAWQASKEATAKEIVEMLKALKTKTAENEGYGNADRAWDRALMVAIEHIEAKINNTPNKAGT